MKPIRKLKETYVKSIYLTKCIYHLLTKLSTIELEILTERITKEDLVEISNFLKDINQDKTLKQLFNEYKENYLASMILSNPEKISFSEEAEFKTNIVFLDRKRGKTISAKTILYNLMKKHNL